MATIDNLGISLLDLPRSKLYTLVMGIRATRRTRPAPRKAAPAKVARAPSKKAPKQQDLFALAGRMTQAQKTKLAAALMKEMMKDDSA